MKNEYEKQPPSSTDRPPACQFQFPKRDNNKANHTKIVFQTQKFWAQHSKGGEFSMFFLCSTREMEILCGFGAWEKGDDDDDGDMKCI